MKKLFYILLLAFVCSVAITSCTEVEVKPSTDNAGGSAIEPMKK